MAAVWSQAAVAHPPPTCALIEGRDVLVSKILSTRVLLHPLVDMLNTQAVKLKSIACSTKPAARVDMSVGFVIPM
jgi:hypothetical protein